MLFRMGVEALMATVQRMCMQVEAVAAVAAAVRARTEGIDLNDEVARRLGGVLDALGVPPDVIDGAEPGQLGPILGLAGALFRQAQDLMGDPGRAPGWSYEDPVVLQSQGRASMFIAPIIAGLAPTLGGLDERLCGGAFLEVGTGVGWLSVAMCQRYPGLRTVGIDVWKPALVLAERNVRDSGLEDRIELREQSVTDLTDGDVFDLAWAPGPFLPREILPEALRRTVQALRPGGWLVFGLYASAPDPLATALNDLRIVRSGGWPWSDEEALDMLSEAGLADARAVERTWNAPVALVVARKAQELPGHR